MHSIDQFLILYGSIFIFLVLVKTRSLTDEAAELKRKLAVTSSQRDELQKSLINKEKVTFCIVIPFFYDRISKLSFLLRKMLTLLMN